MPSVAPGDYGLHAALAQLTTVLVVVIATVGEQPLGTPAGAPRLAGDGTDAVEQRQELSHVVAVPAGEAIASDIPPESVIS